MTKEIIIFVVDIGTLYSITARTAVIFKELRSLLYILLQASARTAVIFKELRSLLDYVLNTKITDPQFNITGKSQSI